MNIIDIGIICVVAIFLLYGGVSGFLKISIVFAGFIIGGILGYYVPQVMGISFPLNFILGILIFIALWVISGITGRFVGKLGKIIPFNRVFGLIVGLIAGSLLSLFVLVFLYKHNLEIQTLIDESLIGSQITSFLGFLL